LSVHNPPTPKRLGLIPNMVLARCRAISSAGLCGRAACAARTAKDVCRRAAAVFELMRAHLRGYRIYMHRRKQETPLAESPKRNRYAASVHRMVRREKAKRNVYGEIIPGSIKTTSANSRARRAATVGVVADHEHPDISAAMDTRKAEPRDGAG